MPSLAWKTRAIRALRHDLTLMGLVTIFVAVSATAITASVLDAKDLRAARAAQPGPFEEQLATYEADLYDTSLRFDWYPASNQEVRVKFQWVGVEADARRGYRLSNGGRLQPSDVPVDDFSISDTAVQIRYRYEIAPLSDFFLVYTRGGYWEEESTGESAFGLFNNAWDEITIEQVLAKIRYRF